MAYKLSRRTKWRAYNWRHQPKDIVLDEFPMRTNQSVIQETLKAMEKGGYEDLRIGVNKKKHKKEIIQRSLVQEDVIDI